MAQRKEKIVLFPFMMQGHVIPFLALALHIERRTNHSITFVNTPLNIKKLRYSLPPESSINLVEIPFSCSDHGLPPNTENTDALPYHLVIRLLEASVSLEPAFKKLIHNLIKEQQGRPPLCIIFELARGKSCEVRHEDIVSKIQLVMNETQEGNEMRRKASQVMKIIRNAMKDEEGFRGSSIKAMDDFFSAAESKRQQTERENNVAA